jgi:Big-like domain-containing protein
MPARRYYSMRPRPSIRLSPVGQTSSWRHCMPHTTPLAVRQFLPFLLAGVMSCGNDLLLPEPSGTDDSVALSKVQGDEQTGTVGEQLGGPLIVRVLNARQEPVSGQLVAFEVITGQGTVTPDTATSNSAGEAVARLTLGTTPGLYEVVAGIVGADTSNQTTGFRAVAKAGAPDTLSPLSQLAQPGRKSREVDPPPEVRVVDRYGNPVENAPVSWVVTAGGGQVEGAMTRTNAEGRATTRWVLGDRAGWHKLTAAIGTVHGSPITFTATVLF